MNDLRRLAVFSLLANLAWSGCSSAPKAPAAPAAPEAATSEPSSSTSLSREQAALRSHLISHPAYILWFSLDGTKDEFEGRAVVNFELKPKARDFSRNLLLDFEEGTVRSITLNGVKIEAPVSERFDGHHLTFPIGDLAAGHNRIEVAFSHPFSTNGSGLYRFKDPADGRVYLYSDLEPYEAHRIFPSFDQPDLKASYELTVEAPADWQVIANTREREVTALEGGRKSWAFPPSPVFSTYLFAMHAGPYSVWKAAAEGIPTRLFARRSMAQYVDHQEWLNITKRGLDHYGLYFGLIYPFGKYDQILVPDYNHGAMENVGAVTFSEKYIFRSKPTTDKRRHRAEVILHEMAHMWFGDLVTMRWWNGLWLNESFATFMAGLATEKATDFQGTWQSFFGEKQWAYWEDQLVTTHPIEVPVPDTDHAEANFDGITYGKGAASLKQLHFYLGDDDFREGLQRYFERFAFRNTTIHDFIQMLSEASSKDLSHWQKSWLQSPGVNTIRAKWTCGPDERGKSEIKQFSLAQLPASTPGSAPELRPHKTQVALFYFAKGAPKNRAALRSDKTMDVTYTDSETQVAEAAEEACPDFVFPNYHDFDYVKVELDEGSLGVLRKHLSQIEDAFTRQMIWHTLWEMVVDAKLRDQDYIDMVLKHGLAEKDTQILENLIENLTDPALKYLAPELSQEYSDKLENAFRTRLMSAPAGSDLQLVWFKAYADVAYTKRAGKFLERLLGGKITLKGFDLEQDRRWTIIQALSRIGLQNAPELIAMERHTDATDIGEKAAIKAEALAPDLAAKQKWFDRFVGVTGAEKMPIAKLREAMRGFHVVGREDLSKAFADRFFEELTKLAEKTGIEDKDLAHRFGEWVWPPTCEDSNVQRATVLLKAHPGWSAAVIKDLLVHRQEEERCIQARKKSAEGIERDEPEQTPIVPVAAPVAAPVAPIASPAAPEQTPEPSPTVEFEVQPDNGPNPSPRTGGSPLPAGP